MKSSSLSIGQIIFIITYRGISARCTCLQKMAFDHISKRIRTQAAEFYEEAQLSLLGVAERRERLLSRRRFKALTDVRSSTLQQFSPDATGSALRASAPVPSGLTGAMTAPGLGHTALTGGPASFGATGAGVLMPALKRVDVGYPDPPRKVRTTCTHSLLYNVRCILYCTLTCTLFMYENSYICHISQWLRHYVYRECRPVEESSRARHGHISRRGPLANPRRTRTRGRSLPRARERSRPPRPCLMSPPLARGTRKLELLPCRACQPRPRPPGVLQASNIRVRTLQQQKWMRAQPMPRHRRR